jgi:hypothetical protein
MEWVGGAGLRMMGETVCRSNMNEVAIIRFGVAHLRTLRDTEWGSFSASAAAVEVVR